MSPRDRALLIVQELIGAKFSRRLFLQLVEDDSEAGKAAREMVATVEKAIVADRAAIEKMKAPS